MQDASNLFFLDLETTGLDPDEDVIVEIAGVPADKDLNILDAGISFVIYYPSVDALPKMNDVVREMHTNNGLLAEIDSEFAVGIQTAAIAVIQYAEQFVPRGQTPLGGSTIHFDRRFLQNYMPGVESFFHYRCADVSSLKEFWKRWFPEAGEPPKVKAHRALRDCYESIAEAKWYKDRLQLAEAH